MEDERSQLHIRIGHQYDHIPFKNEKYVLTVKVLKIVGSVMVSLGSLFVLFTTISEGWFNDLTAWTLFFITLISLLSINAVSEDIPLRREEE